MGSALYFSSGAGVEKRVNAAAEPFRRAHVSSYDVIESSAQVDVTAAVGIGPMLEEPPKGYRIDRLTGNPASLKDALSAHDTPIELTPTICCRVHRNTPVSTPHPAPASTGSTP